MTRGIVVEFLGMPAAGKTTLARAVAERLSREGHSVELPAVHLVHPPRGIGNRASRIALLARRGLRRPRVEIRRLLALRRTRQDSFADLRTVWENLATVAWLIERARTMEGVHLIDQGVFQAIWSVGLSADTFDVDAHLEGMPLPDLLVVLTVDQQTGRSRLAARTEDDSRLGRRMKSRPRLYVHARQVFESVRNGAERLAGEQGFPILALDSARREDLELNARRVAEALEALGAITARSPEGTT
jgi:thymidylate kinase